MIHISKRAGCSKTMSAGIRIGAFMLALATTAVFLIFMGHNPLQVYASMFMGSFGSLYKVQETIKIAVPLIILSLGIMIAFTMKYWNIGAEGQMLMGAFAASYFALFFPNLPMPLLLLNEASRLTRITTRPDSITIYRKAI